MSDARERIVLAVDGGNVKTDLALVADSGRTLALVRGGRSSPHHVGVDGCVRLLDGLLREAASEAGLRADRLPLASSAQIMVAGADLPDELSALKGALEAAGWSERLSVDNDTFALLRSGTSRGWGVAVVCGGGINCVGVASDGRLVRYPALGPITGDWGGGYDVGLAALSAASRSADGRGERTSLQQAVPAYFGLAAPFDVARAVHLGELRGERLAELAPVVFAHSRADREARRITDRLSSEVAAFACATLRRLDLHAADADVVLGGGLMRAAPDGMVESIAKAIRAIAPHAQVLVAADPPIVGAVLLGLDELGAGEPVKQRARSELGSVFKEIEGDGARVTDPLAARTAFDAKATVGARRADG